MSSAEELEERLEDEESERASLVSRRSSRSSRSRRGHSRLPSSVSQGLVSRLMGREGRANYQPIHDNDE